MAMKTVAPFADFVDVLKNMPPAQKQKIIENHQKFHSLVTWCAAKKWIEVLPKMTGVKVLEDNEDVRLLRAIINELNPGGFQFINLAGVNEREIKIKPKKKH